MKTLIVLRHADAEPKHKHKKDEKRPLTEKGMNDAKDVGRKLGAFAIQPQVVLCSSARRARQTAELVIDQLPGEPRLLVEESLYLAEPQAFVDAIHKLPDELDAVMIVGHNPGLREFLQKITDTVLRLPKATAAYVQLPIHSWKECSRHSTGTLEMLIRKND